MNPFLRDETPTDDPYGVDRTPYEGVCRGGPLAGEKQSSRFRKGFLLVDKPANQCWVYEWNPDTGEFNARDESPMEVQTVGDKNRYRAAMESNYDVLAAPWVGEDNVDAGS